jgi:hypothetical protein
VAGAIVLTAIVWGFVILGSPFTERLRKFDDRRVEDLREIRDAITRMVVKYENGEPTLLRPLPPTLEKLAAYVETEELYEQVRLYDPQTGEKYGYKVQGESKFELCAAFSLQRDEKEDMFWNHPAGRHCYAFDLLKDENLRNSFAIDIPVRQ